jgi:hypothetical protein
MRGDVYAIFAMVSCVGGLVYYLSLAWEFFCMVT